MRSCRDAGNRGTQQCGACTCQKSRCFQTPLRKTRLKPASWDHGPELHLDQGSARPQEQTQVWPPPPNCLNALKTVTPRSRQAWGGETGSELLGNGLEGSLSVVTVSLNSTLGALSNTHEPEWMSMLQAPERTFFHTHLRDGPGEGRPGSAFQRAAPGPREGVSPSSRGGFKDDPAHRGRLHCALCWRTS